jgi:ketosteroid isomerase-like protein
MERGDAWRRRAPEGAMMDLEQERKNLERRDAEWGALASEGRDVEAILSYWTEDAIVMPAGLPTMSGKAALRSYVTESLKIPGFRISWKSSAPDLSPDGKLAYMMSENTVTMQGPDGSTVVIPGRALTVWRMEPDGQWRCAVDIWNAPPG